MINTTDSYTKGMSYENFIRRAFQCDNGSKHGAQVSFVRNLIDTENQEAWVKQLPKFEKQLEKVKDYLTKAIEKYLKRNPSPNEKVSLLALNEEVKTAYTSSQIVSIVER